MTTDLVLAAAQTTPTRGDVASNLKQHVTLARLAAEQHAQVVVFPELSLTGYELELGSELAFSPDDARLGPLREEANRSGATLVVGAPLRLAERLHIASFILAPDCGPAFYLKQHLAAFSADNCPSPTFPPPEDRFFCPGELNPLVSLGTTTACASICADGHHRTHYQAAAECGAQVYLSSQFAIVPHLKPKLAATKRFATEHGLVAVVSNFAGVTGGLLAAGGSTILCERGERVVQLPATGAGIALAQREDGHWRGQRLLLS